MIYLDYNATTPVDERVMSRILPFFSWRFGNAASAHPAGLDAKKAVDLARQGIAASMGVTEQEIIFTSGATESCNLAIKGAFEKYQHKGRHIITVKTEHNAVLDCYGHLEKSGAEVTYLDVDAEGLLDIGILEKAIRPDTILISVMYANNETGVIQPIQAIGRLCHQNGILFFCDGTQAFGKINIQVKDLEIDLLAFSGHKIYAPKGVGGLYISRKSPRVSLGEQMQGGGHERGLRSGTLNVPGIVGMAQAITLFSEEETRRIGQLRDQLEKSLLALTGVRLNGPGAPADRMANVTNLSFAGVIGKQLLSNLNTELAVSSGSACTALSVTPSHVLMAMGLTETMAESAIRFSLGRMTTQEEIDYTIQFVKTTVEKLRENYNLGGSA